MPGWDLIEPSAVAPTRGQWAQPVESRPNLCPKRIQDMAPMTDSEAVIEPRWLVVPQ